MEKLSMKSKYIKDRQPPLRIQVEKGFRAFHSGKIINPYMADTAFYKEWERGFNMAYFENLKRVQRLEKINAA